MGSSRQRKKRRWQEKDLEYLEQCLEEEQRSHNSKQLAAKLAQDREVKLSPDHLRRVLKKRMRPSRSFTAARTSTKQRESFGKELVRVIVKDKMKHNGISSKLT